MLSSPSFYQAQCHFSCAHRYIQNSWTDEKNRQEFGACFNPNGHGHDYRLEVEILVSADDSLTASAEKLQQQLKELRQELDHQHLNFHLTEFRDGAKVPTTENLARFCADQLRPSGLRLHRLRLFETSSLWCEITFENSGPY